MLVGNRKNSQFYKSLIVCLGALMGLVVATTAVADEIFDRVQIRADGFYSEPTDAISGYGLDLSLAGHWVLVPGLVAEAGLARVQERYHDQTRGEVGLVSQYGYLGGRLLLPVQVNWQLSAAARGFRGRLLVDDDEQRWQLINFSWLELGLHMSPPGHQDIVSVSARQYLWADGAQDSRLTGEWIMAGSPWAWGLYAEVGLTTRFLQTGISLNHRF
ncbi:MAG: hypothetical protein WEB07_01820 [Natronospirillum sp.]